MSIRVVKRAKNIEMRKYRTLEKHDGTQHHEEPARQKFVNQQNRLTLSRIKLELMGYKLIFEMLKFRK
jgi:hypothetical protein